MPVMQGKHSIKADNRQRTKVFRSKYHTQIPYCLQPKLLLSKVEIREKGGTLIGF